MINNIKIIWVGIENIINIRVRVRVRVRVTVRVFFFDTTNQLYGYHKLLQKIYVKKCNSLPWINKWMYDEC